MWNKIEIQDLVADTKYPIGDGDHGAIKPADYLIEGVPYVRVADISWDGRLIRDNMVYISHEVNNQNPKSHLFPGDLIIAKTGATIGKVAIIPDDMPIANTTSSVGKITFNKQKVYPKFVMFYMRTSEFKRQMWSVSNKSAQPGFNIINLKKFTIPVPPLHDQIKIATILSKAETLVRQRKESINRLDELLKNTFLKMYLTNFKTTQPVTLNELKIGGNETFSNGPFGSDLLTSELTNEGVPVIYIRDIRNGYFKRSNNIFITPPKAASLPNCQVKGNDLLIAKVGDPPGISAVYPNTLPSAIITQDVIRIRINKKIANPFWINFYLNSIIGQQILKKITITGTRNRFSLTDFKELEIRIPQIKIQNQFAAIVEMVEVLKVQFQSSLNDLQQLYASLSQRTFKGELDSSAIEIDESFLSDEQKVEPVITIPPGLQKAIELSNKINRQFEGVNRITKVTSGLTRQIEQWNKLQDQFKNIPNLPEALLQAQKNIERIQESISISTAVTQKIPVEEEAGFNWAVLASHIKKRYKNRHFNFEMLHSFIQKNKLAEATPYYASEELKTNPRLNDAEDLKSFIQTAIQNIEMDEKQQHQINPFLRLTQSFYNAEEENFTLLLHKEDLKLIKDRTAHLRSGIYFSVANEV